MTKIDLPTTPEHIFQIFKDISISYKLYHHEAVFTVKEAEAIDRKVGGTPCRNLFLRDKKKKMFLVTAQNETRIDLKNLEKHLACKRLSFGSPERLFTHLGVHPGSVCPFSVINDPQHEIRTLLEKNMMNQPFVAYHPLLNTMTVTLTPQSLIKFFEHIDHPYEIIDL